MNQLLAARKTSRPRFEPNHDSNQLASLSQGQRRDFLFRRTAGGGFRRASTMSATEFAMASLLFLFAISSPLLVKVLFFLRVGFAISAEGLGVCYGRPFLPIDIPSTVQIIVWFWLNLWLHSYTWDVGWYLLFFWYVGTFNYGNFRLISVEFVD